jgi:DNA-binding IclR family transcriptional regulator
MRSRSRAVNVRRRITYPGEAMKEDRHYVTALARGLDVLRCFTSERVELGSTEIAREIGLSQSTVWRLCYTLQKAGYLQPGRDPEKLRVSPRVLALGCGSVCQTGIVEAAIPSMEEIARRFQASVSIATPEGLDMIIVGRAVAPTVLKLNFQVGSALAMERSALGYAYLAAIDDATRDPLMAQIKASSPDWPSARARIAKASRNYRENGYVLGMRHYHADVNALGVPIVSPDGRRVMAMNCGGATSIMTTHLLEGPIATAMKSLASELSIMLTV